MLSQYFLVVHNNINIVIHALGLAGYILLHNKLDMEFQVITIVASYATGLYLIIAYYTFGEIHEASKILVNSWKRCLKIPMSDKKLLSKYLKSLDLLKLHHGTFGYYTKPNRIIIFKKLIFYTTKSVMTLQNIV